MPDNSPGLRAEARGLEAIKQMQKDNWEFRGFRILKTARTFEHPEIRIRNKESKKIDIIVAFTKANPPSPPGIFVLQVKSTHKSYNHFCNNKNHKNIKCILIFEHEPIEDVIRKMDAIFKEVLGVTSRKNQFFRKNIPVDLL